MINDYKYLLIILLVSKTMFAFPQNDDALTIGMTDDLDFKPSEVTIQAGETIIWENTSQLVHTVTFDPSEALDKSHVKLPEGIKPFGSGKMNPGDTYSHTFKKAGTYKYFCIPHESSGMLGKVIVEDTNGASHQDDTPAHQSENETQQTQQQNSDEHDHAENSHEYESYEKIFGVAAKFEAFPNLHPMIVHFPVVLLMLAAVVQIAAFTKNKKIISWGVLLLIAGGFVGGLLAAYLWHPNISADASVEIREIFNQHKSLASATLWISGIALLLKLISIKINLKRWTEIAVLILLLISAGTVGYAGHLGSQMVYIENVGPQGKHVSGHSH